MSSNLTKVIIFGSHGKIGQHLIKLFAEKSSPYTATAVIRSDEQAKTIKEISDNSSNVKTLSLSLNDSSSEELSKSIQGHDVVVFTAGSGGKDLLQVDLDGAVKTFEASVLAKTRRYILVSAISADNRNIFSKSPIRNYFIAKHYADRILINEFKDSLDYTILQPPTLTDGPATGKIDVLHEYKDASIDRADVAKVIFEVIRNKATFGKSVVFAKGETPITDPKVFDN